MGLPMARATAVYFRGDLIGVFEADDVASGGVLMAVALQGGEQSREEDAFAQGALQGFRERRKS
jgi:hypothetical protein